MSVPRLRLCTVSVCLSVCMSDDDFGKPSRRKSVFAHPVYLQRIRVKFRDIVVIGSTSRSKERKWWKIDKVKYKEVTVNPV